MPFTLLIQKDQVNLIEHTRAVTLTALRIAEVLTEELRGPGRQVDRDVLLAGAILHDVGQALRIRAERRKSSSRAARASSCAIPISGAAFAFKHGPAAGGPPHHRRPLQGGRRRRGGRSRRHRQPRRFRQLRRASRLSLGGTSLGQDVLGKNPRPEGRARGPGRRSHHRRPRLSTSPTTTPRPSSANSGSSASPGSQAPEKIVIVLDHIVPAADEKYAQNHKTIREFVAEQGIPNFFDIEHGVCHQVLSEAGFALPGDGHRGQRLPHDDLRRVRRLRRGHRPDRDGLASGPRTRSGSAFPRRSGSSSPASFRPGVFAKDVILKIIGDNGADRANYEAVEFAGPAAGGFQPRLAHGPVQHGRRDGGQERLFRARRRHARLAQGPGAGGLTRSSFPTRTPRYEAVLTYDLSTLEPQIACPHTVDNVKPVSEVEGKPFHQALIGTCTNGRLEDLEVAARILQGPESPSRCPGARPAGFARRSTSRRSRGA